MTSKREMFNLTYGITETTFGKCFMGLKESQICYLSFLDDTQVPYAEELQKMQKLFPKAASTRNDGMAREFANKIFNNSHESCQVYLKGTDFQLQVWEYLRSIKYGSTLTYEEVARGIGRETAVRAVANAISKNNIAYVVPCHRVVKKNGKNGKKFKWGMERKLQMLKHEQIY